MRLFSIFLRKKEAKQAEASRSENSGIESRFSEIREDIERLRGHVDTIHIAIRNHDDQLGKHREHLQKCDLDLEQLVQRVAQTMRTERVGQETSSLSNEPENPILVPPLTSDNAPCRLDIDQFTEQERRIMEAFFCNKDTWLSYAKVGQILGKSAYTVKNQMRQIRKRGELFDRKTGRQSRNLFRLRGDLRIEKYLNVGRSIERPVPTAGADRPDHRKADAQ